jgi:hypothetical protein
VFGVEKLKTKRDGYFANADAEEIASAKEEGTRRQAHGDR